MVLFVKLSSGSSKQRHENRLPTFTLITDSINLSWDAGRGSFLSFSVAESTRGRDRAMTRAPSEKCNGSRCIVRLH